MRKNYPAHKLEFLALKWAVVDKLHDYLYGNSFTVRTDNNPLTYVLSTAKLDATSHRWLASLANYNFSIQYRSGKTNTDADALSRLPSSDTRNVVFADVVKALCLGSLVSPAEAPAIECLSLSQQTMDTSISDFDAAQAVNLGNIDWKVEQSQDDTIARVVELVRKGHRPTKRLCALERHSVRHYLKEWKSLFLKDGILYRKGFVQVSL